MHLNQRNQTCFWISRFMAQMEADNEYCSVLLAKLPFPIQTRQMMRGKNWNQLQYCHRINVSLEQLNLILRIWKHTKINSQSTWSYEWDLTRLHGKGLDHTNDKKPCKADSSILVLLFLDDNLTTRLHALKAAFQGVWSSPCGIRGNEWIKEMVPEGRGTSPKPKG